jgi:hypothetical protein
MGPVLPNAHAFIAPKSLNFGSFGNYLNPGTGAAAGGTLGYGAGAGLDAFDAHVGNKNYNWAAKLGLAGLTAGSGIGGVPQFIRSRIPINPLAAASNAFSRNVIAPLERSGGPIAQGIINSGRLATNLAFTPKMRPFYQMFPKTVADSLGTAETLALGGVGAYGAWQGVNALPDATRDFLTDQMYKTRDTAATQINKLPAWLRGGAQNVVDTVGDDKKIKTTAEDARKAAWQKQFDVAKQVVNPYSNFWKPAGPLSEKIMHLLPPVARPIVRAEADKQPDMAPLAQLPWFARPAGSWTATYAANRGAANAHHGANYVADQFRSPQELKRRQLQRLEAEKQRASGGGE